MQIHAETPANAASVGKSTRRDESPFLIKLAERRAFERDQLRVFAALLAKYDAIGGYAGGPTRGDLEDRLLQLYAQYRTLSEIVDELGEPRVKLTPPADADAGTIASSLATITDPRTGMRQCIEALLLVELAGMAGWKALVELADEGSHHSLWWQLECARANDEVQLVRTRAWLAAEPEPTPACAP